MDITSSLFLKSATHVKDAPSGKPAFAFIGRSNVGKSSLINALTNRKNLARTSVVPGKTQLINYFLINDQWFLVDLPGYGWAKVSKKSRLSWERMVKTYLTQAGLTTTFLLIDSRHKPQKIDLDFIDFLHKASLPYALVFTKVDKSKKKVTNDHLKAFEAVYLQHKWSLPPFFITTAKGMKGNNSPANTFQGNRQLLSHINDLVSALEA